VAAAERAGKSLDQLTAKELQAIDKNFGADASDVFNLTKAMARRNLPGAPGTKEVERQLARWRKALTD
jgi:argininosuccinate lyase